MPLSLNTRKRAARRTSGGGALSECAKNSRWPTCCPRLPRSAALSAALGTAQTAHLKTAEERQRIHATSVVAGRCCANTRRLSARAAHPLPLANRIVPPDGIRWNNSIGKRERNNAIGKRDSGPFFSFRIRTIAELRVVHGVQEN
jgi:hypothetical protein